MNLKKNATKETKRVRDVGHSGRQRRTAPLARVAEWQWSVTRCIYSTEQGLEVRGSSFVMSKGCEAHMLGNQGSALRGALQ